MSVRRLSLIFGRDFALNSRRIMFYIWVALVIFLAWSLSSGKVRIQSGDSSIGGTKSFITSEFAVAQLLVLFVPLIYGFFASVVGGMSVIHDEECQVGEVLHATPLRAGEYIWGKFLATLAIASLVLALHLAAMMVCNHALPAGDAREFRGPFALIHYLRPGLIFAMPTIVFFCGLSFAIGEWTRRPILVYFMPVAVFLGCGFFLWDWAPSWLDPKVDRFLMVIDPAGYRWMNETLLKVNRGVSFYNSATIPLDSTIIGNRLLFLAIGLGSVALSRWHYARALRGVSRRAEKAWKPDAKRTKREELAEALDAADTVTPQVRPLGALGMTSRRPGLIAGALTVMRAEVRELRSSPGLYLFVPLLVLEALGPNLVALGAFDTPLLLTSGTFAVRSFNPLTTMTCLLLMFYSVESLWRERQTRLASISLATPVRTGSILLGKALANSLVGVAVVVLIELVVGVGFLLYQGKVGIQACPFALIWGVLAGSDALSVDLVRDGDPVADEKPLRDIRDRAGRPGLHGLPADHRRDQLGRKLAALERRPWSDISVLELDRLALWLNRGWRSAWRSFSPCSRPGSTPDATSTPPALRRGYAPPRLLKSGLRLLPVASIPIVLGFVLWAKVDGGSQGGEREEAPERLLAEEPGHLQRLARAGHHGRRPRPWTSSPSGGV